MIESTALYWGPMLSLIGLLWTFHTPRPRPVTKQEMQEIADGIDLQPLAQEVADAMQGRHHATLTTSPYANVRFHLEGRLETW